MNKNDIEKITFKGKACLWIILLIVIFGNCDGQNLVPNGDFEQFSSCPTNYGQLNKALYWSNPSSTMMPAADYFNPCYANFNLPNQMWGYQTPNSGNSFAGYGSYVSYISNNREYMQVELSSPLITDSCYHLEMYVSLANKCHFTTDALGVFFSDTMITGINNNNPLPFTPQIENISGNFITDTTWMLLAFDFIAGGGENYMIIGNFKDDINTNVISVVSESPPANFTYFFVDDVTLFQSHPCHTGLSEENSNLKVYPTPFDTYLNIQVKDMGPMEFILYDISSRKLINREFFNSTTINTAGLAKGIYVYVMENKNGVIKKGRIVKN